jgi:hypothetical protein
LQRFLHTYNGFGDKWQQSCAEGWENNRGQNNQAKTKDISNGTSSALIVVPIANSLQIA